MAEKRASFLKYLFVTTIIILALSLAIQSLFSPITSKIKVTRSNGDVLDGISFPIRKPGENGTYIYDFTLNYRFDSLQATRFHVTPDDCVKSIKIKGKLVDLVSIKEEQLCDWMRGFEIDLKQYLKPGSNPVQVVVDNTYGFFSLDLTPANGMRRIVYFMSLMCAVIGTYFIIQQRKWLPFSTFEYLLLIIANAVYVAWIASIKIDFFAQDLHGHLPYIEHMAQYFWPPHPMNGWTSYHPPLFYALYGYIKALLEYFDLISTNEFMRTISLFIHNGLLIFSLRILHTTIQSTFWQKVALVLVCFWPSGIMIASRIDSSVLFYFFTMISFFYLLQWLQNLNSRNLAICFILLAFAILTRSNSYIIAIIYALIVFNHAHQNGLKLKSIYLEKKILATLFLCCLASVSNTGRTLYYKFTDSPQIGVMIGNREEILQSGVRVTNTSMHYLTLQVNDFFENPFFDAWRGKDRAFFWNIFIKTASFGEFHFDAIDLSIYVNLLMLLFMLMTVIPIFFYNRDMLKEKFPFIAMIFVSIAALIFNRYNIPVGPSGDFRYIFYTIVPFSILFVSHIQMWRSKQYVLLAGIGMSVAFLLPFLSVMVYMLQAL